MPSHVLKITAAALLATAAFALADTGGETTATFLTLGVGGRPTAMGEAYTGVAEGVNSLAYNPAGVAFLDVPEVSAMHAEWFQGMRYEYVAFAYPLAWGSVGGAARALTAGGMERRTDADNPSEAQGTFGATDVAVDLSYAYPFSREFGVGVNLKGIDQELAETKTLGFAGDVGAYWAPWSKVSFGLASRNLGPDVKFAEDAVPLPMTAELGAAYRPLGQKVVLAAAAEKPFKGEALYKAGVEYNPFRYLSTRAGYISGVDTGGLSGVTAGLGVNLAGFSFDFAYAPYGDLGNTYRVGFTYGFGRERKRITTEVGAEKEHEFLEKTEDMIAALSVSAQDSYDAGEYTAAGRMWDLILVWDPDNAEAAAKLEATQDRINERDVAEHVARAEAFFAAGKFNEAALEYKLAQKIDPTNAAAITGLAKAEEEFARAEERHAAEVNKLMVSARDAYGRGDYGGAIGKWEEVLKLDADNAEAADNLSGARVRVKTQVDELKTAARRYEETADWTAALNRWNRALDLAPDDEDAAAGRARARAAIGRDAGALVDAGVASYERGDVNGAEAKFLAALNLQPDNVRAGEYVARIKQRRASAKTTTKSDNTTVYLKGIEAYTNHQYRAAVAYWQQIPAGDPMYAKAQTNIKRAKAVLKELEER